MTQLIHWEPWQVAVQLIIIVPIVGIILWAKFSSWFGSNN